MRRFEHAALAGLLVASSLATTGCADFMRNTVRNALRDAGDELREQQNESEPDAVGTKSGPDAPMPTRSVVHSAAQDAGGGIVDGALGALDEEDNAQRLADLEKRLDEAARELTRQLAAGAIEGAGEEIPKLDQSIRKLIQEVKTEFDIKKTMRSAVMAAADQVRIEMAGVDFEAKAKSMVDAVSNAVAHQLAVQDHRCVITYTEIEDAREPPSPTPGTSDDAEAKKDADRLPRVLNLRCTPHDAAGQDLAASDVTLGTRLVILLKQVGVIVDERVINVGEVVGDRMDDARRGVDDTLGDTIAAMRWLALALGGFLLAFLLAILAAVLINRQRATEARKHAQSKEILELVTRSIKEAAEKREREGTDGLDSFRHLMRDRVAKKLDLKRELDRFLDERNLRLEKRPPE